MAKDELHYRANWQTESQDHALNAENSFHSILQEYFEYTEYEITDKPKDFVNVYRDWPLQEKDSLEIYNPQKPYKHGFQPDFSIKNTATKKTIFVEIKRQDGWIEGLSRSAGRGNAHERLCKYFTPGLLKLLRDKSKIKSGLLPFWVVFVGNVTRDPCRVREITCWFDIYTDNFLFWRNTDPDVLREHFSKRIAPLLD